MKKRPLSLSPVNKLLRIMKLSALLMIITVLHVAAEGSYAQSAKVNLNMHNAKIGEVFDAIEKQSNYEFFYNDKQLNVNNQVSIKTKDTKISDVLNNILAKENVNYEVIGNRIVIVKQDGANTESANAAKGVKQVRKVTGTITDASTNEPLIGANVTVEGTTKGVVTDMDGKYSIEVPNNSAFLVVSYIGYNNEKVEVTNQNSVDVQLIMNINSLNEVVVVGYGTQKKVNVTGAVAALSGDNVSQKAVTQLSAALQGMAPGVTITQGSGQPGADAGNIRIRGVGTLNDNDPLVLVDGIESDINSVDANDIESYSILKDAASSSIYGVKAANGVILITTKRGNKEKTKVSYSGYYGIQDATMMPNYVGAQDFMKLVNTTRINSGAGALYSDAQIAAYDDPNRNKDTYPDSNWLKEVMKGSGIQQEHSIAVAGGTEKSTYRFSSNYFEQEGLVKKTNFDRLTLRLNTDIEVNQHLSLSADMSGKFSKRKEPQGGMWFQFGQAHVTNPLIPVKYANGDWSLGRSDGNAVRLQEEGGKRQYEDNVATGNFKVNYKIIEGLSLSGNVNGIYTTDFNSDYTQALTYNVTDSKTGDVTKVVKDKNSLTNETSKTLSMNYIGLLNYTKTIDVHSFTVLLGASKQTNSTNYLKGYRENGSLADLPQLSAGDPSNQTNEGNLNENDLLSYFGRLNYAYNDKYLLEANIRRDASSRFSKENHWASFPSFSAGWRISKEAFMSDISFVKELKLRGSWGQLGNQNVLDKNGNVNNYAYQSLIDLGSK